MPYHRIRRRGLGAQIASTRGGPTTTVDVGALMSAARQLAQSANSGNGLTNTRMVNQTVVPTVVSTPVDPQTQAAPVLTGTPVSNTSVNPVAMNPFADPWFLGYLGIAALAAFTLKGGGKMLAAIPAALAWNQIGVDTVGSGIFGGNPL